MSERLLDLVSLLLVVFLAQFFSGIIVGYLLELKLRRQLTDRGQKNNWRYPSRFFDRKHCWFYPSTRFQVWILDQITPYREQAKANGVWLGGSTDDMTVWAMAHPELRKMGRLDNLNSLVIDGLWEFWVLADMVWNIKMLIGLIVRRLRPTRGVIAA